MTDIQAERDPSKTPKQALDISVSSVIIALASYYFKEEETTRTLVSTTAPIIGFGIASAVRSIRKWDRMRRLKKLITSWITELEAENARPATSAKEIAANKKKIDEYRELLRKHQLDDLKIE